MKTDIHPTYYPEAKITCSCGAVHQIGSTRKSMTVEICSECHPFYTGKEKLVDTAGRVEKFKARQEKARTTKTKAAVKRPASRTTAKKKAATKASTAKKK